MPASDIMKEMKMKLLDGVIQIDTESRIDSNIGIEDLDAWNCGSLVEFSKIKFFTTKPIILD